MGKRCWDLDFPKHIYIFLLNLSENNYGNSSAEARTDVLLKLQWSSVNMHKSWEGGSHPFFVSIKTSPEKSEKPPIRLEGLPNVLGPRPSELGIRRGLGVKSNVHFVAVITGFKSRI